MAFQGVSTMQGQFFRRQHGNPVSLPAWRIPKLPWFTVFFLARDVLKTSCFTVFCAVGWGQILSWRCKRTKNTYYVVFIGFGPRVRGAKSGVLRRYQHRWHIQYPHSLKIYRVYKQSNVSKPMHAYAAPQQLKTRAS